MSALLLIYFLADPNKPKKPLSAYFLFTADKREEMKAKYPDLKVHELAKKMGELWKETTEKSKYEKKAEEAKERYKNFLIKLNFKFQKKTQFSVNF